MLVYWLSFYFIKNSEVIMGTFGYSMMAVVASLAMILILVSNIF
ncbi:hypothetical protein HD_1140 [[Haemophilus] ducreyi 35000HP]|uniref:Uncharacterized protein n=1 Tax=Haemophilus ducreyi (strain 35000HP / ATCC 700724) TaxID=233412 RepID=Q7VM60_HAEDU|nr:hypothetical protein HD_1140 [[Haemophilus] ducreyi 35000HP]